MLNAYKKCGLNSDSNLNAPGVLEPFKLALAESYNVPKKYREDVWEAVWNSMVSTTAGEAERRYHKILNLAHSYSEELDKDRAEFHIDESNPRSVLLYSLRDADRGRKTNEVTIHIQAVNGSDKDVLTIAKAIQALLNGV